MRRRITRSPGCTSARGHQQDYPGITLPAPKGHWDLSPFLCVEVDLRNPGTEEVTINGRVDNLGADGIHNCVTDRIVLAPGESGTLCIYLRRIKPDWIKVELPRMRGRPWHMAENWLKPGEGTIDKANVTDILIFVTKPARDHTFEIRNIRAAGEDPPVTEKLMDPKEFLPFIDEFGQYVHWDWPGKA